MLKNVVRLSFTCRMIPAVPTQTASVKIQRNSLSSTMATYFQSSFTWEGGRSLIGHQPIVNLALTLVASSLALVCSAMKLTQAQDLCRRAEQLEWS